MIDLSNISPFKWASRKQQQIIKQVGTSGQLFEAVNFAFIKSLSFGSKEQFLGITAFLRDAHLQKVKS